MESGIVVYKKIVPGVTVDETILKCLVLYGDKLYTDLNSRDSESRESARNALKIEEMLANHSEDFLPERFKRKEYSRLKAVYAFPFEFPEEWCYPNLVPLDRCFTDGETVIKMVVDGSSALVLPMCEVDSFYYSDEDYTGNQRAMKRVRTYWESAVSLGEFDRDFVNPNKRGYEWYSRDGTARIEKPEVIIPEWNLEKVSFVNISLD